MSDESNSSLGEGIVYEDRLPLSWTRLAESPQAPELAHWNAGNERVLRLVSVLEEHLPELGEEHTGQGHELGRLEFKVDLLLEMMGQMLASQLNLPDPKRIRINAQGIEWDEPEAVGTQKGSELLVSLYLHAELPRPLNLYGRVEAVTQLERDERITLSFAAMSEGVRDWLEKLIFRHHRRSIAHTRPGR